MSEQEFDYLREEEISRKALQKRKSNNPIKRGELTAFLKYGEELVEIIEEEETPYINNSDIREKLENTNHGDVGRMMNFIQEYDVADTWTDNDAQTIWITDDFDTEGINKIYEVLEGYGFDY